MRFFIDTANLNEIREINNLGILDGVTTNPSLMAKEGITGKNNIFAHYKAICQIVEEGDISAEVLATDYVGMVREGEELADIDENIVVKVPMTKDGIRAIHHFTNNGIRTNCTLIFSAAQALIAAKAGASYVSPFVGRLDDISTDGLDLIQKINDIFLNYDYDTEILAASLRHPMHVLRCAEIGAHVVTAPAKVFLDLFNHPLTDAGLKKFIEDGQKLNLR